MNQPMQSVHTQSFPALLAELKISLAVSTYQAGRLIILRNENGTLNTHLRMFQQPMGVAFQGGWLSIGTRNQVWEFANVPAVTAKLPTEPRPADACFIPRRSHVTGDIHIHEMEYDSDGVLWAVNTKFSCLSTISRESSFEVRWKPSFITGLAPEDRCHLNGLGMVDGRPKYVTALGETDTPAGWRDNKATGGILIEIDSGEILARGLSMPHSPRLYADKLWVLNSGEGGFGYINPKTGSYETVTTLPGFTRGLSFWGSFAFIGLSQVRESAIFSGIRIAEMPEEDRWSGVYVVNWQTGETVAFLKFEQDIHEVFAVTILPSMEWPDLINDDEEELIGQSYVLPDDALSLVPENFRSQS